MNTIGSFARSILATNPGIKHELVVAMVKEQFPTAETTVASIAWYKSKMKKEGIVAATVKVERTIEVVKAEIEQATLNLEMLKIEHDEMMTKEEDEERATLARLLAKYESK